MDTKNSSLTAPRENNDGPKCVQDCNGIGKSALAKSKASEMLSKREAPVTAMAASMQANNFNENALSG